MDRWGKALVEWIEIPSVTGEEGAYADALARALGRLGVATERQELAPGRWNLLARAGVPAVVLCTHPDTVPPWFGSRVSRGVVHGRGACDAKGAAAAMLAAAERLLAEGEDRFGFLFTAGEETDSAGAVLAERELGAAWCGAPWSPRHVIVGEPTDGRFVSAHKGLFKASLLASGVAGHSSQAVGPSAVHELVHALGRLLEASWGEHPLLGAGTLNVGTLDGGLAPNVVAPHATCSLLVRTVEPPEAVRARVEAVLGPHVALAPELKAYAPVEFLVPGDPSLHDAGPPVAVAFGTDAPHLGRFGRPLLMGPGSILDAHTETEKLALAELDGAAARYARCVRWLLER
jgi:acetylornithine deacetylase